MGIEFEFNWYIVVSKNNTVNLDEWGDLIKKELVLEKTYSFVKDDYRVYPMDTPLPMIYEGRCIGMWCVTSLHWENNKTHLELSPVIMFEFNDTVAKYYEDSFRKYKSQQEEMDDGGKIDVRSIVNGKERRRLRG